MSGEDEPSHAVLWPATRAGKVILFCLLVTTCCVPEEKIPDKKKSFIFQAFSVNMAGYWPCSFLHFCGPQLFFIHKQAKMNLANIMPALHVPHAWLITHLINPGSCIHVFMRLDCDVELWGGICPHKSDRYTIVVTCRTQFSESHSNPL